MNEMLTLKQMAEKMNITARTLNKYVALYDIPHVCFGRDKRFNPEKVEKHLESVAGKDKTPAIKAPEFKRRLELPKTTADDDFFARELGLK